MTYRGPQKLQPTPTSNRLVYLRACERHGIYSMRHGATANHCLRLGLVETVVKLKGGCRHDEVVAWSADGWSAWRLMNDFEILGQRLTPAGLAFLDKHMPNRSRP